MVIVLLDHCVNSLYFQISVASAQPSGGATDIFTYRVVKQE